MHDHVLSHSLESGMDLVESEALHSGPAVAATLAPVLGLGTLMVTHHLSRLTRGLDQLVHSYGYWMPGSTGSGPDGSIGSYSGKETLALLVWGGSWLIFHQLWRKEEFAIRLWLPAFAGALALIMLGFFHPIADPIVLALARAFGIVG